MELCVRAHVRAVRPGTAAHPPTTDAAASGDSGRARQLGASQPDLSALFAPGSGVGGSNDGQRAALGFVSSYFPETRLGSG